MVRIVEMSEPERELKNLTRRVFDATRRTFSDCEILGDNTLNMALRNVSLTVSDFHSVYIEVYNPLSYEGAFDVAQRIERDFSKEGIEVTLKKRY